MKNKTALIIVFISIIAMVLGCSRLNPFSGAKSSNSPGTAQEREKNLTDKVVDTTVGDEKIGIPECDAVMDELVSETKNEKDDEGYIAKAFRKYWENFIRESIRKSIEENKNDPKKLATECKKLQVQLEKFKTEQKEKEGK